MLAFHSLYELLSNHFPGLRLSLGGQAARRPQDEERFRQDLEKLARRLRRRGAFVTGIVAIWFAALVAVGLLSGDPIKSLAAIGAMSAGTPWCVRMMRTIHREMFALELLLRAASNRSADARAIAKYCDSVLNPSKVLPPPDAPQQLPAGEGATM